MGTGGTGGARTATAGEAGGLLAFLSVSRLHIVAIAALGTLTFGWLFTGIHDPVLPWVAAVDWFLVNLVNRLVDLPEDRLNRIVGTGFVDRHRRALAVLSAAVLGGSFVVVQALEPSLWPLRLGYHSLGMAYNLPWIPWRGRRLRLKELYLVKNTASALGFVLTVFGYPLAAHAGSLRVDGAYLGTTLAFFFLSELAYEVIYDLRDVPGDRAAGVATFPVVHGHRTARHIVFGLLAGSAAVQAAGYALGFVDWAAFVMVIGLGVQLGAFLRFDRRGVTARDCIGLTLAGAGLLALYNLWVAAGLPLHGPF